MLDVVAINIRICRIEVQVTILKRQVTLAFQRLTQVVKAVHQMPNGRLLPFRSPIAVLSAVHICTNQGALAAFVDHLPERFADLLQAVVLVAPRYAVIFGTWLGWIIRWKAWGQI